MNEIKLLEIGDGIWAVSYDGIQTAPFDTPYDALDYALERLSHENTG